MLDALIIGGTVIDGTGNAGYAAAVGIDDGRVVILRGTTEHVVARRVLDASGMVIAPGFIDVHSHSSLKLLDEPLHLPKLTQGVTTEVIGVDGLSYAPFACSDQLRTFVDSNAGLEGKPDLDYSWNSFDSFISRFDRSASVNVAGLIGNSALRIGSVGWDQIEARPEQVRDMQHGLRQGMEEGAFGLSSGLDYPPGSYASTDELVELCRELPNYGGIYHTHVRYWAGDRYLDPFREALEIAERSGAALHITHLHAKDSDPGGSAPLLDLVEDGRSRGLDITFDNFPYEHGASRLSVYLPQWIQSGGPAETIARLADPDARTRFKADLEEAGDAGAWRAAFELIRVGGFRMPENEQLEGRTLWNIALERQQDVLDVFCDLLVEEELGCMHVDPAVRASSLAAFVTHPLAMVGTDATFVGDKPSPRTYGSFPRILGELVRDERLLKLPEAIRKFTSFPAQRLGLKDRGILRDGLVADITVFDPQTVAARATYTHPRRQSVGIEYVFVNGVLVLDRGNHTGATPGIGLRRGS